VLSPSRLPYAFLLVLLLSPVLRADSLAGKVVKVVDADTIHLLDAFKTLHKVRLSGIDAPERRQAFGHKSKDYLAALVAGKLITVDWHKRDRYQRIVGKIIHEGRDVNLLLVRAGLAWWYRKYASEQSPVDRVLYEAAEDRAKEEHKGLWSEPSPVPPWEWRHR